MTHTCIDSGAVPAAMPITHVVMPSIDEALVLLTSRELISAAEAINTLLDLRLIAANAETLAARS